MRYELYYWPSIQGRGEAVRLALEEAGADYVDVARGAEKDGAGVPALLRLLNGKTVARPPFAPPFLKAGKLILGQTANILMYLGTRHGLAPQGEQGKLWAHQLQLTLADFLDESHDIHHPIGGRLYYEEQRPEAKRRAVEFREMRAPKYLGYFETVLARNPKGDGHLVGARLSYPDLSLFQIMAGLRYAVPNTMARLEKKHPRCVALHDMVAGRRRIAAYLASERRLAFNQQGVFRHYQELDEKP